MTVTAFYRHAETLKQLDNGKKVPPTGWKCERCELTTNLWLNLTDGAILCGRKYVSCSISSSLWFTFVVSKILICGISTAEIVV